MMAMLGFMPYPIPDGEAEINAENNYMWPEAVDAAREMCIRDRLCVGRPDIHGLSAAQTFAWHPRWDYLYADGQ